MVGGAVHRGRAGAIAAHLHREQGASGYQGVAHAAERPDARVAVLSQVTGEAVGHLRELHRLDETEDADQDLRGSLRRSAVVPQGDLVDASRAVEEVVGPTVAGVGLVW